MGDGRTVQPSGRSGEPTEAEGRTRKSGTGMVPAALERLIASIGDFEVPFEIDDYTRWRLLEGLDDIGLTLRSEDKIAQFEARREAWRPRTLPVP